MTTTTATASNGSTDTTTAEATGQKERPFGMARVREAETYHTATILYETASEIDNLCDAVYRAVSDAYFRDVRKAKTKDPALTAVQMAESPPMQARIREALNCLQAAEEQVRRLLVSNYDPGYDPPF